MNVTGRKAGVGKEQEKMKMSADSKWEGADCESSEATRCKGGKEKETIVIQKGIKRRMCAKRNTAGGECFWCLRAGGPEKKKRDTEKNLASEIQKLTVT